MLKGGKMHERYNPYHPNYILSIGAYIGWFLGGFDGLLYAHSVAFCSNSDYITGLTVAILHKKLSSSTGFKGYF